MRLPLARGILSAADGYSPLGRRGLSVGLSWWPGMGGTPFWARRGIPQAFAAASGPPLSFRSFGGGSPSTASLSGSISPPTPFREKARDWKTGGRNMHANEKRSARAKAGAKKGERLSASLYQEITDRIIAELERGTVPWASCGAGRMPTLGSRGMRPPVASITASRFLILTFRQALPSALTPLTSISFDAFRPVS
ncbi:hypothetical protein ACG873_32485 [Mesorhizobium sp. AaZ16]|uniref:hypothetical protein n=1 Tax=Mesorhizobium sp. AaZ16 TaxID=3402289 RepID=UPI00374FA502